jgi:hypothetical protein
MKANNIYMAGFFDGEGYVGMQKRIRKGKYTEYFVVLSVGQKDGATIDWIKENYGGHIHLVKRDGTFFWIAANRAAYNVLKQITPYLKYKKPQAELALSFFDNQLPRKQSLSEEEQLRRENLLLALKAQKKVFTSCSYYKSTATTTKRIDTRKGDVIV